MEKIKAKTPISVLIQFTGFVVFILMINWKTTLNFTIFIPLIVCYLLSWIYLLVVCKVSVVAMKVSCKDCDDTGLLRDIRYQFHYNEEVYDVMVPVYFKAFTSIPNKIDIKINPNNPVEFRKC